MIIKDPIIAPYEIHVDQNQYIVGKEKPGKDGPVFYSEKFYSKLDKALQFICRSIVLQSNEQVTIQEYIDRYSALQGKIQEVLR